MSRLLIATGNEHKLAEMRSILSCLPVDVLGLHDVSIGALPEETGKTFEENATIKAAHCANRSGLLCIADDSGIEVDALGREPGVYSNRWAGPDATDADRVRLLLERVQGVGGEHRSARFVSVIAVAEPGGTVHTFRGTVYGLLTETPRGSYGFGYDPVFYVPELHRTVAELTPEEKNRVSHRAVAMQAALPTLHSLLSAR